MLSNYVQVVHFSTAPVVHFSPALDRIEASGLIQPADEVPFHLPGVRFCILDPDEVRFQNMNTLGMQDRAVDILVGVGVFQQVTHQKMSRAVRRRYESETSSRIRELVNKKKAEKKAKRAAAKAGKEKHNMINIIKKIGRSPAAAARKLRGRRPEIGEIQELVKCQNLISDAREVAAQRSAMLAENAPRMDVVEVDQALGFLQHSVLQIVRPMVDDPCHPLRAEAMSHLWEITDLVADTQDTECFASV